MEQKRRDSLSMLSHRFQKCSCDSWPTRKRIPNLCTFTDSSLLWLATDMSFQFEQNECPVCGKYFPTSKGMHVHLKTSLLCRSWGKGKRRQIYDDILQDVSVGEDPDIQEPSMSCLCYQSVQVEQLIQR